jgi:hypothetical protein
MFDYSLLYFALFGLHHFFSIDPDKTEWLLPIDLALFIPIEAAFYRFFGTTPGKALMKVKLHFRPNYTAAVRRAALVWMRGMGFGIPVINFFCMLFAYQRLFTLGVTSWDKEERIHVSYGPIGPWRVVLAVAFSLGGAIVRYTQ